MEHRTISLHTNKPSKRSNFKVKISTAKQMGIWEILQSYFFPFVEIFSIVKFATSRRAMNGRPSEFRWTFHEVKSPFELKRKGNEGTTLKYFNSSQLTSVLYSKLLSENTAPLQGDEVAEIPNPSLKPSA